MLTQDEQDLIMKKVQALRRTDARLREQLVHYEISPKSFKESTARSLDELRELLKEIG